MPRPQHTSRKAAILLASLEPTRAERLLAQMPEAQAQQLRQAMTALGPIDSDEQRLVIEEFFRIGPLAPQKEITGVGPACELSLSAEAAPVCATRDADQASPSKPFEILESAPVETISALVAREHPQAIAVIVSHLDASRAAQLLASLPAALQADVARRLVDLEQTDPEILRELELALECGISDKVRSCQKRTAGMAALANILGAADQHTQRRIMTNLSAHDRQLAARLAPSHCTITTFADLVHLDDSTWNRLLHRAAPEVVVLALAGATDALVNRVLRQLPQLEADRLRAALRGLGPTRPRDVEQAQYELTQLARQIGRGRKGSHRGLSLAA